jgi:cation transport ATPase
VDETYVNMIMSNYGISDRHIDSSLVHRGDILRLVEGENIAADGIVWGNVGVDESMMTVMPTVT